MAVINDNGNVEITLKDVYDSAKITEGIVRDIPPLKVQVDKDSERIRMLQIQAGALWVTHGIVIAFLTTQLNKLG